MIFAATALALRLACLGDSNTMAVWQGPQGETQRWCEYVQQDQPSWTTHNYGWGGMTVCPTVLGPDWPDGDYQMAHALADDPTDIVLAFGTNDLRVPTAPLDVLACYQTVAAMASSARVWVALTPPLAGYDAEVDALNAAIMASGLRWIDLHSGMTPYLYDGIHLNVEGQHERARRVENALAPAGCL